MEFFGKTQKKTAVRNGSTKTKWLEKVKWLWQNVLIQRFNITSIHETSNGHSKIIIKTSVLPLLLICTINLWDK